MLHRPQTRSEVDFVAVAAAPAAHVVLAAGLTALLVFSHLYLAGIALRPMATTAAVSFVSSCALGLILRDRRRPTPPRAGD